MEPNLTHLYVAIIGSILALAILVRVALYYSEKGRKMAGNDKRVVFIIAGWDSDPIILLAQDKKGLLRVANEHPKCRYQVFDKNKALFKRFKPVRFLKMDIQKGII